MNSQPQSTPMVPRTVGELVYLLSERACARGLTEAEAALSATHELGRLLRSVDGPTRRRLRRHAR
jgi:hypothetical protein